jgi:CheY-like chemotaxis protein/predicted transcriptional regulator
MSAGARRVLIIDDDRRVLQIFERVLERAGFACLAASDPEQALDLLQRHPDVGVVVTDLMMPGLNGIELMRQIRSRFATRLWLQLVVITGNATLESAVDSLRLEAAEYLQKPVSAADLTHVVTRAAMRADTIRLLNATPGQSQGSIRQVAELAGRLAGQIRAQDPDKPVAASLSADGGEQLLRLIWQIQAARREVFHEDRLQESSWEMLSELMSTEFAGRRISVSGLCLAAGCPVTTALRRIDELIELGLIAKEQDPADARRQYVRLTDSGRQRMEQFLWRVSNQLSET